MSQVFDRAFSVVVGQEGGLVKDPNDPGGETNFGISKRAYPKVDIENLTLDQAKDIYRRDYWAPIKGDFLPSPLGLFVFDAAVNQGVDAAIKMLQRALGCAQDGIIGAETVKRAQAATPWHMAKFMALRAMRYQGTRNFDRYGEGWLTRTYLVAMEA